MRVLLNIGNEVAPRSNLSAHRKELRYDREKEMRIPEEIAQVPAVTGLILVLAVNRRKFRAQNKHRPYQRDRADDQIGFHYAKGFGAQIRFIGMTGLLYGDLLRRQLDPGKNEHRADQGSRDRAYWIKRLREIQTAFRAVRIAQLGDEGIRCGLQERQAAGDYEERQKKKSVAAGQRRWPEQKRASSEKYKPDDETRFVSNAAHEKCCGHGQ